VPCRALRKHLDSRVEFTNMDLITQLFMLMFGGLCSAAVLTSVMFYKQIKREKTADAELAEAQTKEVLARIEDNRRINSKFEETDAELSKLRTEVGMLQSILLDLKRGILILTLQVVEANLIPAYTIPNDVTRLLRDPDPEVEGPRNGGG